MTWFKRRIEVLLSVEADNEEEANDLMEEAWQSSQMAGTGIELWPDKSEPDTWVEVE